jgi:hypothetical protein
MTPAALAGELLTLAGLISFPAFLGPRPFCLLPLALFVLALLLRRRGWRVPGRGRFFLPFAAGLLIWPMRLFYWDRGDFQARVQNLLLLASLFALYFLARAGRWPRRFLRHFNSRPLRSRLLAIIMAAEALFILAAAVLTWRGVALAGDEPHYLAISQSIARDRDLNVFNQYFRDGYKEFLDVDKLPAHGTWGMGYKKIYSYHLPGISLTLAPFFFFRLHPPLLYFLLRAFLGVFGALLAALVYLFCLRLWRSRSLAFFATFVFTLSAPVFFYSIHVFPEVQAMLLILSALYLLFFKAGEKSGLSLWAGLLLGAAIFWGVKYALFIYPVALGFFAYWSWKKKFRPALLLLVFPLFFQALFFYYLYHSYGNLSPNSVYYGMLTPEGAKELVETILSRITLNMRWETLLDYFFDQRDGLLLYNPFYLFAFPGLLLALRHFKRYRLQLLVALPALLFVLNHAFSTIRPGYCPQGRYLTPVAWALLLFALIYYRESRNRFLKNVLLALPLYSIFVSAYQAWHPMTLYQPTTHDTLVRPGLIFANWSNIYCGLPGLLPSYIKTDNSGYLPNHVILALFLLFLALALRRSGRRGLRLSPLVLFLAVFSLSSLFPRPDLSDPQPFTDERGRPVFAYFSPRPAARVADQAWIFCGPGDRGILLESRLPFKNIRLQLENRSPQAALRLEISAFDQGLARRELPAGGAAQVDLQPPYKKLKGRFFYQLHLRGEVRGRTAAPTWRLSVLPR